MATPAGATIRWALGYDLAVAALTLGRERAFREQLLAPAKLKPGESVLDIGCGTGSLAMVAASPNSSLRLLGGLLRDDPIPLD